MRLGCRSRVLEQEYRMASDSGSKTGINTYEDDDSQATKKQISKHEQAVSKLFRQCGFQEQPRRRRACRIVIRLGSVRRHVRIAMRDLYWSADRSGGWSRNQRAGEKRRGRIAQPTDRRWTVSPAIQTKKPKSTGGFPRQTTSRKA